jgi:hypothetical protein
MPAAIRGNARARAYGAGVSRWSAWQYVIDARHRSVISLHEFFHCLGETRHSISVLP